MLCSSQCSVWCIKSKFVCKGLFVYHQQLTTIFWSRRLMTHLNYLRLITSKSFLNCHGKEKKRQQWANGFHSLFPKVGHRNNTGEEVTNMFLMKACFWINLYEGVFSWSIDIRNSPIQDATHKHAGNGTLLIISKDCCTLELHIYVKRNLFKKRWCGHCF